MKTMKGPVAVVKNLFVATQASTNIVKPECFHDDRGRFYIIVRDRGCYVELATAIDCRPGSRSRWCTVNEKECDHMDKNAIDIISDISLSKAATGKLKLKLLS